MSQMPQMQQMMGMQQNQGPNLLSIILNVAFGYVGGLMLFLGPMQVLTYGSHLASELLKTTGYGAQMSMFGAATTAAPYVVLAPIVGLVGKELSSVRSLKGFGYFAAAVLAGIVVAFLTKGYFAHALA
jgi:hypothetical protein